MQRIPRPSTRAARAEGEGTVSEAENLILGQIRNYFDLPFSRHFHKFSENQLANRILRMISIEDWPYHLNIFFYTDPANFDPERPGPIPREDVDSFFVKIGNYILALKNDDFDLEVLRRKAELKRQINGMEKPIENRVVIRRKRLKIKRS